MDGSLDLTNWRYYNTDSGVSIGENMSENNSSSLMSLRKLIWNSTDTSTTTMDSGYADQSFVSDIPSSTISSFSRELSSKNALSSVISNLGDSFMSSSKGSRESCTRSHGYTRFGLALIIALATEKDLYRHFYMKHISFIQSILTRLRHYVDFAFHAPDFFLSIMVEISHDSAQWLVDLSDFLYHFKNNARSGNSITSNILRALTPETGMPGLSHIGKVLKSKWNLWPNEGLFMRKNKVRDLFDVFHTLLKEVEVKEKNFFLSRLVTAVLTYHLGWIETCVSASDQQPLVTRSSYNALWCQLIDLCGNVRNTTLSRTIINGNDIDMIKMILVLVQFFVRCFEVQRRDVERDDVDQENDVVNLICEQYGSLILGEAGDVRIDGTMKRCKPLPKQQTFNLANMVEVEKDAEVQSSTIDEKSVMFILGDDEKLVNLEKADRSLHTIHENESTEYSIPRTHCFSSLTSVDAYDVSNDGTENVEIITGDKDKEKLGTSHNGVCVKMKVLMFPLPRVKCNEESVDIAPFDLSLRSISLDKYVPDMIIQGTTMPEKLWKKKLKDDIFLRTNENVEAVAILADVEKWNVQILTNKTYFSDKTGMGEPVDASELVSNMLEVLFEMGNLRMSKQYCITHIEQRLLEICLRSRALAQLLLATDFCTVNLLVSTLQLEIVDVPLLMSVASNMNPAVTQKYGLSYQ